MKIGSDIHADISFTGNTVGLDPSSLSRPDTFSFSLTEGEKDFGIPFIFNNTSKKFEIKKETFPLTTGVSYKFRGLGINKNSSEPVIVAPEFLQLDTILIENVRQIIVQGKIVTEVDCNIKIKSPINPNSYFHFIPLLDSSQFFKIKAFHSNHSAFKRLKHKPGFMVDYTRILDNEIKITLEATTEKEINFVNFELYNTTLSYYQYNYYISNITTDSYTQNSEIPAIAGFNIKSDKAFGTFSAISGITKTIRIK